MLRTTLFACSFFLLSLTACASQPPAESTTTPAPTLSAATPTAVMGCSVISAKPIPQVTSALPPITTSDYIRGPAGAPVTLLAYCDFQSEQCKVFNDVLDQLVKNHAGDLQVVLRPFPVPTSVVATLDKSQISVQALIAAGNQNKFWEMRDRLDLEYAAWNALSVSAFESWVAGQAAELGLDRDKFARDRVSSQTADRAKGMYTSASTLGIKALLPASRPRPRALRPGRPHPAPDALAEPLQRRPGHRPDGLRHH